MKKILYLRYVLLTTLIIVLVSFFAYSLPAKAIHPMNSTPIVQGATEKHDEIQTDAETLPTTAQDPYSTQTTYPQAGLSILENNCARCHSAQWLKKIKKTQTEWEITLTQMERKGVRLSDTEKVILIDYLVFPVEP